MEKYYIVDSTILPDVLDKVIEARSLLQNGEVKQVSEAVKRVGISRGTYYKYKDYVFLPAQGMSERKAVISLMLQSVQVFPEWQWFRRMCFLRYHGHR